MRPRGEILAGTFQIEAWIEGDCARWRSTKRFADFRELACAQGLQSFWRTAYERSKVLQDSGVAGYPPRLQQFLDSALQDPGTVRPFLGLDESPNGFVEGL